MTPRQGSDVSDRVTMGLLEYVNAHALDEDYAEAVRESEGPGDSARRVGVAGGVMLAVFALFMVVAGLQTSRNSAADDRERAELFAQVQQRRARLNEQREQVLQLQQDVARLQRQALNVSDETRGLAKRRTELGAETGADPVHGPGALMVIDDAPGAESDRDKVLDSDLQRVVNGLWEAGAEAISINGQRLTTLTAIRHAGKAITVNFVSLSRPYRVSAIGDRRTLRARFAESTSGRAWFDLQRQIGLQYSFDLRDNMRLPGTGVPTLRHIEPGEAGKKEAQ